MAYVKKTWVGSTDPLVGDPGSTALNADSLNHLETQYEESVAYTDAAISALPPAGVEWGGITGDIADQVDLAEVLAEIPLTARAVVEDALEDGAGIQITWSGSGSSRKGTISNIATDAVESVNGHVGEVVLTQDDILDGTTAKQYTATEKTKLSGIASGATANQSDAVTNAAIAAKANAANPVFTGTVTIPDGALAIADTNGLQAALDGKQATITNSDSIAQGSTNLFLTGAERTKLSGIAPGATANQSDATTNAAIALKANIASPTFTGTVSGITKAMVGLGNVDNTADASKTFAQSQITNLVADLAGKAPTSHTHTASQVTDFSTAADARITASTTVVKTTGAQSVAGVKTFTDAPVFPDGSIGVSKLSISGTPTGSNFLRDDGVWANVGTEVLEAGPGVDEAAISNFVATGGTGYAVKKLKGNFTLTGPIIWSTDNRLLDTSEANLSLAAASYSRMLQVDDTPLASTTGSISSGSATLTTATTLSSAYIGKTIVIAGAGGAAPRIGNDAGGSLPGAAAIHARIVGIAGTTVTLSRTARATVSGAAVKVLQRYSNVNIRGGRWERLAGNSSTGFTFTLERVDGFSVEDVEVVTHDSKFAMYFGDFTDGVIDGVTLDSNSDGISLSGPGERLVIQNVHGHTEDDGVSLLAASEYAGATLGAGPWGDLVDITINNINIDGVSAVAVVSSALATCDRILIDGVMHEGIDGTVKVGNWVDGSNQDIGSVVARNISGLPGVNGSGVVLSRGPSQPPVIKSLVVENVEYLGANTAYPTVAIEGVAKSLSIKDARGPRILQIIGATSEVRGTISNAHATGTIAVASFGKMDLSFSNVTSVGDIIQFYGSGANNSRFDFDGLCATGGGGTAVMDNSSGVTYTVTGAFGAGVATAINANAASDAYVWASSVNGSWGTDGAGAFHPRNFAFRLDANKAAPEWGATVYNTNPGAATGGDGPALANGGSWTAVAGLGGGGGGSGDVVGPGSAANNNIAVFDGTTGKLIKDGGATVAALANVGIPTFISVEASPPSYPTGPAIWHVLNPAGTAIIDTRVQYS